MFYKDIFVPIHNELAEVKKVLEDQIRLTESLYGNNLETLNYFFRVRGKFLRPALVLLSAKAIGKDISAKFQTINTLAAAVELIHSASLIHDDLVDEATERRGQPAVQHVFNKKMAVLSGDFLLVRAFSILSCLEDDRYLKMAVPCIEQMCISEMDMLRNTIDTPEAYFRYIELKTAQFMAMCCQFGGMAAMAEKEQVKALSEYGYHFGVLYQLVDDYLDEDSPMTFEMSWFNKIQEFSDKTVQSLSDFHASSFKQSLIDLTQHLMSEVEDKMNVYQGSRA